MKRRPSRSEAAVSAKNRPKAKRRRRSRPPYLELLEERNVLATYTVTGTADGLGMVTPTGIDTFDATTLRAAVIAANASVGVDDTILLAANSTYVLTETGAGEDAAMSGDLDITDNLTIQGADAATTIIDGNLTDRVFHIFADFSVAMQDVTIRNGRAPAGDTALGGPNDSFGGGILNRGNLELLRSTVTGNQATGADITLAGADAVGGNAYGGGIFNGVGTLTLTNSTLSGNFAVGGLGQGTDGTAADGYGGNASGGGIHNVSGDVTISGSTIAENRADAGDGVSEDDDGEGGNASGGGINSRGGNVIVTGSTISNNVAEAGNGTGTVAGDDEEGSGEGGEAFGGGIANDNGTVEVTESTVSGNRAMGGSGEGNAYGYPSGQGGGAFGGGLASDNGVIRIQRSTFSTNQAIGGVGTSPASFTTAGGSVIGGGIFASDSFGSTSALDIINSTISGNIAQGGAGETRYYYDAAGGDANGGGIGDIRFTGGSTARITNTTIVRNQAIGGAGNVQGTGNGGGVLTRFENTDAMVVGSTLIAQNTTTNGTPQGPDVDGTFNSLGNNLIGDGSDSTGFTNMVMDDQVGSAGSPIDPLIGPLAFNGGPTQTHELLTGPTLSPAIDRGAVYDPVPATDQRGPEFLRTVAIRTATPITDVGAYEVQNLLGSLSGFVFLDLNNNGIFDVEYGETGIAGVTLTVASPTSQTVATAVDGSFLFSNLPLGTYTITQKQPAGLFSGRTSVGTVNGATTGSIASATANVISNITLTTVGNTGINYNFAELPPANLSGSVYADVNASTFREAPELGLSGVVVAITGTDDLGASVSATTTTDANGDYAFLLLRPGSYQVAINPLPNFVKGQDRAGTLGGFAGVNQISAINVAPGQNGVAYLFAFTGLAPELISKQLFLASSNLLTRMPGAAGGGRNQLHNLADPSGHVYLDLNRNGIRDADEPGLANILLTLAGTTAAGAIQQTTTTDAAGFYSFGALAAGVYSVSVDVPPDLAANDGTPGSLGGIGAPGRVTNIIIGPLDDGIGYDFGLVTL